MIKFDKKFVYLKNLRLDSSDLLIAQLVERQTSIHEVVGSSPTRRSKFSNLNLYNSPCVRAYRCSPPPSLSQKNAHSLYLVEVIKFDKKFVCLKNLRLDSSDLLIAQLVERQTSIHEVVGSSPTRRSKFSNLNLYNSPCVRTYGVSPPPSLSQKKTHTACT